MGISSRVPTYNLDKFIQEQIDSLIKHPKTHELIERISYQEEISREKALQVIMNKFANYINSSITIMR